MFLIAIMYFFRSKDWMLWFFRLVHSYQDLPMVQCAKLRLNWQSKFIISIIRIGCVLHFEQANIFKISELFFHEYFSKNSEYIGLVFGLYIYFKYRFLKSKESYLNAWLKRYMLLKIDGQLYLAGNFFKYEDFRNIAFHQPEGSFMFTKFYQHPLIENTSSMN